MFLPALSQPVSGLDIYRCCAALAEDDEAAVPSDSAAASKSEMSKLDSPQIPDDASDLEVDTRTAGGYSG
jgi:hypothetical protein